MIKFPSLSILCFLVANFVSLGAAQCRAQPPKQKVFLIGNSLTWDTLPGLLDGEVLWHVDCGKNLTYIYDHPQKPCVRTSTPWDKALENNQFDVLCVQPHFGTTLDQDTAVISAWLKTQKDVKLVIHTGWNRHKDLVRVFRDKQSDASNSMTHAAGYFAKLETKIKQLHPDVDVTSTHAIEVLDSIQTDIETQAAPIDRLSDLYRDDIHVTTQAGRYLMHNLMRVAIGQEASQQGFQVDKPLLTYLRNKVDFASKIRSSRLVAARKN